MYCRLVFTVISTCIKLKKLLYVSHEYFKYLLNVSSVFSAR